MGNIKGPTRKKNRLIQCFLLGGDGVGGFGNAVGVMMENATLPAAMLGYSKVSFLYEFLDNV